MWLFSFGCWTLAVIVFGVWFWRDTRIPNLRRCNCKADKCRRFGSPEYKGLCPECWGTPTCYNKFDV